MAHHVLGEMGKGAVQLRVTQGALWLNTQSLRLLSLKSKILLPVCIRNDAWGIVNYARASLYTYLDAWTLIMEDIRPTFGSCASDRRSCIITRIITHHCL